MMTIEELDDQHIKWQQQYDEEQHRNDPPYKTNNHLRKEFTSHQEATAYLLSIGFRSIPDLLPDSFRRIDPVVVMIGEDEINFTPMANILKLDRTQFVVFISITRS